VIDNLCWQHQAPLFTRKNEYCKINLLSSVSQHPWFGTW